MDHRLLLVKFTPEDHAAVSAAGAAVACSTGEAYKVGEHLVDIEETLVTLVVKCPVENSASYSPRRQR